MKKDLDAFKRAFRARPHIGNAAIAAGYSPTTASRGLSNMPAAVRAFVREHRRKLDHLAVLGSKLTAEEQENVMRGAIFANIAEGKDRATSSIRLGMQDRRVNMLTPENQVGIFTLTVPADLAKMVQPRELADSNEPLDIAPSRTP